MATAKNYGGRKWDRDKALEEQTHLAGDLGETASATAEVLPDGVDDPKMPNSPGRIDPHMEDLSDSVEAVEIIGDEVLDELPDRTFRDEGESAHGLYKPFTSESGRAAGLASAEARRRRKELGLDDKSMRSAMLKALDKRYRTGGTKSLMMCGRELAVMGLLRAAASGSARAMEMILKMTGELPTGGRPYPTIEQFNAADFREKLLQSLGVSRLLGEGNQDNADTDTSSDK